MIELTRLNGKAIVLNSDLIKSAEASPDTMITLINGEKIIVRESCREVAQRVIQYRACLLAQVVARATGADLDCIAGISALNLPQQQIADPADTSES